jgi:hypothetical protein
MQARNEHVPLFSGMPPCWSFLIDDSITYKRLSSNPRALNAQSPALGP